MAKKETVKIFDTTLRDGEQAPGASMNQHEKMEIARTLEDLGVDIIEAGFPIASKGDFESVKAIAKVIKKSTICGLSRSIKKDIEAAAEAIKPAKSSRIHVFLATSKIHMQHKFKKGEDEIYKIAVDAVKYARKFCDDIEFSPEDASRSDKEFLYRVLEGAIKAGATTVNIPDTVGYATPQEYGQLIADIKNNVPNINKAIISAHCHDDLGLAVANSISAVQNGARQIECTINGVGERAGNASMEEVVMALRTRADFYNGLKTNIKTQQIMRASRLVSKCTGFNVPPNKAIVGANAFRHESGIHQDGVLKNRSTYEIMQPKDVGVTTENLVLGKHSGRHAFRDRLKSLGVKLTEAEIGQAFEKFKDLCDRKKEVFDSDLVTIVENEIHSFDETWQFVSLVSTSGTTIDANVELELTDGKKKYKESKFSDGPVDACYKAIESITGAQGRLLDYSIRSVSQGKDALGEVTVKVNFKGTSFIGHGSSTDILEASAKAYIHALNKFLSQNKAKKKKAK